MEVDQDEGPREWPRRQGCLHATLNQSKESSGAQGVVWQCGDHTSIDESSVSILLLFESSSCHVGQLHHRQVPRRCEHAINALLEAISYCLPVLLPQAL